MTFIIDEGPRYKIRNVAVKGNKKYGNEELLADLKLKNGEYFNQAKMTADMMSLQDKYGGVGYVFAKVTPDPRFLEEDATLDLIYNLEEGARYSRGQDRRGHQGRISAHENHDRAEPPFLASGRYRRYARTPRERTAAEGVAVVQQQSGRRRRAEDRL